MRTSLAIAILVVGLITAACGAPQQSTAPTLSPGSQRPTTSQQPTESQGPTDTQQPVPTTTVGTLPPGTPGPQPSGDPFADYDPNAPPEPLGAPEFETPEEITEAMFMAEPPAEQVVVSMLELLGIGLYKFDGTAIRAGSESKPGDLFLYEDEARVLIDSLENPDDQEQYISFRDFHAAVADLFGYDGTVEDLAADYSGSYAADPAAQMSQYTTAAAFTDPEASLTLFAAWMLLVDGFVPANAGTGDLFLNGATAVAPGTGQWNISLPRIQPRRGRPPRVDPLHVVHLMLVLRRTSVEVIANPSATHEGHGGPGAVSAITARVNTVALRYTPPSFAPGVPLVPVQGSSLAGITVNWEADPILYAHGAPRLNTADSDAAGEVMGTYTPQQEDADGQGYVVSEAGTITARVDARQLITRLYGMPSLGALVSGQIVGERKIIVAWHVLEAMRVKLINHYDVRIKAIVGDTHAVGDDEIQGILAKQEDGTWTGILMGRAVGNQNSIAFGRRCISRWDATQALYVVGEEAPNGQFGDFVFKFFPLWMPRGPLAGASVHRLGTRTHRPGPGMPPSTTSISISARRVKVFTSSCRRNRVGCTTATSRPCRPVPGSSSWAPTGTRSSNTWIRPNLDPP